MVVILAVGVAATVILLVIETMQHIGPISAQESTVLSTVLGAAIGAIATYLGGHARDGSQSTDDEGGYEKGQDEPERGDGQADT